MSALHENIEPWDLCNPRLHNTGRSNDLAEVLVPQMATQPRMNYKEKLGLGRRFPFQSFLGAGAEQVFIQTFSWDFLGRFLSFLVAKACRWGRWGKANIMPFLAILDFVQSCFWRSISDSQWCVVSGVGARFHPVLCFCWFLFFGAQSYFAA